MRTTWWAAKAEILSARGLDKIVVLSNLCFAILLAIFGAEHLRSQDRSGSACPLICHGVCLGRISSALRRSPCPWRCYKNSGALVGPAVRGHDGCSCGDDLSTASFCQTERPDCLDNCRPRIVVRRRRLDSRRNRDAQPRRKQAHNHRPHADSRRRLIFWRRAFSVLSGMSRSPARKTDACVDSGPLAPRLSDRCNSSDRRHKYSSRGKEREDRYADYCLWGGARQPLLRHLLSNN